MGEYAGAAFDMSVTFTNDAFGGSCGRGVGNCAVNGPDMDVSANAQSTIQGVAVHEIGHGMGLLHEHQMPGAPPLCPYEKGILDSCRSCIAASDMGTPCAVSHYKGCFGKTIVIAHILDGNERATAQRYIDDRATVSDAKVLTTYDPLSIMDYCNYTNGRDRTDFTATDPGGSVYYNTVEFDAEPAQGGTLCTNGKWRARDGSASGTTPDRVFIKDGVTRGSP